MSIQRALAGTLTAVLLLAVLGLAATGNSLMRSIEGSLPEGLPGEQSGGEFSSAMTAPGGGSPSQTVSRTIHWSYNEHNYSMKVQVPADLLAWDREILKLEQDFYRSNGAKQRWMEAAMDSNTRELILACSSDQNGNVTAWATEEANYAAVAVIGNELSQLARREGLDRFHTAELAQSFVCNGLKYRDSDLTLPIQTLMEDGDCDCKSVLLASLLKSMGYDVALLKYPSHMAVGVAFQDDLVPRNRTITYYDCGGRRYYFAETTGPGWLLGQISDLASQKTAIVYPVE